MINALAVEHAWPHVPRMYSEWMQKPGRPGSPIRKTARSAVCARFIVRLMRSVYHRSNVSGPWWGGDNFVRTAKSRHGVAALPVQPALAPVQRPSRAARRTGLQRGNDRSGPTCFPRFGKGCRPRAPRGVIRAGQPHRFSTASGRWGTGPSTGKRGRFRGEGILPVCGGTDSVVFWRVVGSAAKARSPCLHARTRKQSTVPHGSRRARSGRAAASRWLGRCPAGAGYAPVVFGGAR